MSDLTFVGKPLTSTLLTSTFVFRSGGVPLWGVRPRVVFRGDFLGRVFTKNSVPGAPLKGIKRVQGHPPALKIKVVMSKVVFSGLLSLLHSFGRWRS